VIGRQLDHRLGAGDGVFERERVSIWALGADRVEGGREAAEVLWARRGDDVDTARDLLGPLQDAREASDRDVADAVSVERPDHPVGIELRACFSHRRRRLC
jgi:hypothetical protein